MPVLRRIKYAELAELAYTNFLRDAPDVIAVDTETEGGEWYHEPFAATIAWLNEDGVQSHYFEILWDETCWYLWEILNSGATLVFHNAKFDIQKLILCSMLNRACVPQFEDTEALAHLIDEHSEKGLKPLAKRYLNESTDETKRLRVARRKLKLTKDDGMHKLPREIVIPYAKKDAEFTIRLWYFLRPKVEEYPELLELYLNELDLTLVLLDIEAEGMAVDKAYLVSKSKEYARLILEAGMSIEELTGKELYEGPKCNRKLCEGCPRCKGFNPDSHGQVLQQLVLRGIHVSNTQAKTLKPHEGDALVAALLARRSFKKIYDTYLQGLLAIERDGIVHPHFRQHKPSTGRMSSSKGGKE